MIWISVAVAVTLAVVGAYALHRALTAADRRGWIYYRNPNRPAPRPMGLIEEIYQPSATHAVEQETVEESIADDEATGEPDTPGPERPPTRP